MSEASLHTEEYKVDGEDLVQKGKELVREGI